MPYPVTPDFNQKMQALERRVHAKAVIDYTDPFLDQSIEAAVSEEANVSYPVQVADSVAEPFAKIASLDGSCTLDGTYHLAPRNAEEAATHQMGWWGHQLAGIGGAFSTPCPTLTVTHEPRPIHTLKVVGDSRRMEWPVDFRIDLYAQDGTLLRTESVSGNTQAAWSAILPSPVLDVAKQVLTITRWSHEGRQAKILEFFTSIQETYLAGDLISINLLEEREVSQGSIPVGNISANEVAIALSNKTRKFDIDNDQSPLKNLLKVNRKVRLWLGADAENLESERPASFSRNSVAYNPEDGSQVAVNEPRYVDGPFPGRKALLVEEGTQNIAPAGSDNFVAGWVAHYGASITVTPGQPDPFGGNNAYRIQSSGGTSVAKYTLPVPGRPNPHTDTVSVWIKVLSGNARMGLSRLAVNATSEWQRLSDTIVDFASTGTHLYLGCQNASDNLDILVYEPQVENKPYATSYILPGSARSPEVTTIPTAVLNPHEGTFECYLPASRRPYESEIQSIIDIGGTGPSGAFISIITSGVVQAQFGDGTTIYSTTHPTVLDPSQTYYIAVGWKAGMFDITINDVTKEKQAPHNFTPRANAYIGSNDGALRWLDGSIAELRISSRYRTPQERLAAYQSNAPLPVDEWTTYLLPLNGSLYPFERCWVPLGMFWTLDDWDSPDDKMQATVTARDRLELLRKGTYQSSQVLTNISLGTLAELVLHDAGLTAGEYAIDAALYSVIVPYAWFQPVSHREALRLIAEAGLAVVYCDRLGVVRMEAFGSVGEEVAMDFASRRDYFRTRTPVRPSQVINEVIVTTQPLRPATSPEEVYRSNQPISIAAGQTVAVTVHYNAPPVIETVASLESPPAGVSIVGVTYYGWGAEVEIHNTSEATQQVTLVISGKPLSVMNRERAIARDEQSIIENAVLRYEFPANHLIQSLTQAQTIADTLLASAKDPRRDIEIDWRGNPALLLGDRIRVKGADYHVTANEIEWAGSLRETTTARRVI